MNPMLEAAIGGIVRHGLSILAGYLVSRGIWTESEASTYVVALTAVLVSVGWSQLKNLWDRRKLVTALATPATISEADVEALVKSTTLRPPVTLSKERTPYPVGETRQPLTE